MSKKSDKQQLFKELFGEVKVDKQWQEEWKNMPEFNNEDLMSYRLIKVHFKSEKDVQEFAKLIDQKIGSKTNSLWYPCLSKTVVANLSYIQGKEDNENNN